MANEQTHEPTDDELQKLVMPATNPSETVNAFISNDSSDFTAKKAVIGNGFVNEVGNGPIDEQAALAEIRAIKNEPFTCSICGLLKSERVNSTSKYCRECRNGYHSYRGRRERVEGYGTKVTMDEYRTYREREGLPFVRPETIHRGRPVGPDPSDLGAKNFRDFWKFVAENYQLVYGTEEHRIVVYMGYDERSGQHMYMEATPNGTYTVHGRIDEFETD
jgi:hypothetical protein